MSAAVLIFAVIVVLACIFLLVRTQYFFMLAEQVLATRWIYLAAILRLLIGGAIIASAHAFAYPQVIAALGWLLAFSAIVLVSVPQPVWVGMAERLASAPLTVVRFLLVLGLCFGGFIVYAAL